MPLLDQTPIAYAPRPYQMGQAPMPYGWGSNPAQPPHTMQPPMQPPQLPQPTPGQPQMPQQRPGFNFLSGQSPMAGYTGPQVGTPEWQAARAAGQHPIMDWLRSQHPGMFGGGMMGNGAGGGINPHPMSFPPIGGANGAGGGINPGSAAAYNTGIVPPQFQQDRLRRPNPLVTR